MTPAWTALLPLKPSAERKTRLAARLSPAQRVTLTETLLARALAALRACPKISDIRLLTASPKSWPTSCILDHGRGLNAELQAVRQGRGGNILVVFPDLPFVTADDISALLAAARSAPVIAPDRHGTGTNAIALPDDVPFTFAFGEDSFSAHAAQGNFLTRPGLAFDIDTPEDFDASGLEI